MSASKLDSVARVLAKLEPGGAQLSVLRVVCELQQIGIRSAPLLVGWASREGLALAARMGVEVDVYGRAGDLQWRADPGFAGWLASRLSGAEVVHAHMFGAWWAAAVAVDEGVALVASEHNALTWPTGPPPVSLTAALERVDRFYAHGPGARQAVLAAGLASALVHDGVSPIAGLGSRPRAALPTPRLVFAGRLHPDKGPDVLLDALARLPDAPPALLLGAGPLQAELAARIEADRLGDRIELCGWQTRPGQWIAGASLLVVPSRDESWSQAAVLAMALGVPVIGTDVDGLPDTLADGRGIVVPAGDAAALATAIDDLLKGRRSTDLAGARRYARSFTAKRVGAMYAGAYQALHAGRGSLPVAAAARAS